MYVFHRYLAHFISGPLLYPFLRCLWHQHRCTPRPYSGVRTGTSTPPAAVSGARTGEVQKHTRLSSVLNRSRASGQHGGLKTAPAGRPAAAAPPSPLFRVGRVAFCRPRDSPAGWTRFSSGSAVAREGGFCGVFWREAAGEPAADAARLAVGARRPTTASVACVALRRPVGVSVVWWCRRRRSLDAGCGCGMPALVMSLTRQRRAPAGTADKAESESAGAQGESESVGRGGGVRLGYGSRCIRVVRGDRTGS